MKYMYGHENDNLRMIYQLHFCFEGFRFWLYKQSSCIPDLFSSDFIISENDIKCQSSHMKHRYCKNYNISCQVIYTFNISQYCICISRFWLIDWLVVDAWIARSHTSYSMVRHLCCELQFTSSPSSEWSSIDIWLNLRGWSLPECFSSSVGSFTSTLN